MKEFDFIGSENVVIMGSPIKNSIIGELFNYSNGFILSASTNKKIVLVQKKQRICESF